MINIYPVNLKYAYLQDMVLDQEQVLVLEQDPDMVQVTVQDMVLVMVVELAQVLEQVLEPEQDQALEQERELDQALVRVQAQEQDLVQVNSNSYQNFIKKFLKYLMLHKHQSFAFFTGSKHEHSPLSFSIQN